MKTNFDNTIKHIAYADLLRTYKKLKEIIEKEPYPFLERLGAKLASTGDKLLKDKSDATSISNFVRKEVPIEDTGDEGSNFLKQSLAAHMYKMVHLYDNKFGTNHAYDMLPSAYKALVPQDQIKKSIVQQPVQPQQDQTKSEYYNIGFKTFIKLNEMPKPIISKEEHLDDHRIQGNTDEEKINWIIDQYKEPKYYKALGNVKSMFPQSILNLFSGSYDAWEEGTIRCVNPLAGSRAGKSIPIPQSEISDRDTPEHKKGDYKYKILNMKDAAISEEPPKEIDLVPDYGESAEEEKSDFGGIDHLYKLIDYTFENIKIKINQNVAGLANKLAVKTSDGYSNLTNELAEDAMQDMGLPSYWADEFKDLLQKKFNDSPEIQSKISTASQPNPTKRLSLADIMAARKAGKAAQQTTPPPAGTVVPPTKTESFRAFAEFLRRKRS